MASRTKKFTNPGSKKTLTEKTNEVITVPQCYIKSDHELPEMTDDEDAMLAEAFHVEDNSRLGCQIQMTAAMNGLEVELAPEI